MARPVGESRVLLVVPLLATLAVATGCSSETQEDLHEAGKEIGDAAAKTAEEVDEAAQEAGSRVSAGIESAEQKVETVKDAAQVLSDASPLPDRQAIEVGITCADEQYAIDRALYDELVANPLPLADDVRFEPVGVGEEMVGYRLTAVAAGSIPDRLGFRTGDVLLQVDHIALDEPPSTDLTAHLEQADEVRVTIERNGARVEKTFVVAPAPATAAADVTRPDVPPETRSN